MQWKQNVRPQVPWHVHQSVVVLPQREQAFSLPQTLHIYCSASWVSRHSLPSSELSVENTASA